MLMISVVAQVSTIVNGISATLLVLQLNLFQLKRSTDDPPLTTGATFKFADLGASSVISGERSPTRLSVMTRHRASMSMVEGQDSNPGEDGQGSIPLRVTFMQHDTDDHFVGTISSNSAVNSNLTA
ncbi:hypothetical protein FRB95_014529 [Tulasnella sp. JGI-2019a]|nr:hypothetical protein FRB95_014529 [Tulasnella sp. JGI-2019a]